MKFRFSESLTCSSEVIARLIKINEFDYYYFVRRRRQFINPRCSHQMNGSIIYYVLPLIIKLIRTIITLRFDHRFLPPQSHCYLNRSSQIDYQTTMSHLKCLQVYFGLYCHYNLWRHSATCKFFGQAKNYRSWGEKAYLNYSEAFWSRVRLEFRACSPHVSRDALPAADRSSP